VVFMPGSPEQLPPDFAGAIGAVTKPYGPDTLGQVVDFVKAYIQRGAGDPLPPLPARMRLAPGLMGRPRNSANER
jgi:hypothetical protein